MTGWESPTLFTSPLAWLSLRFLFPVNNYLHVRCRDCVEQKWRASVECYWNSIRNKMCNRAGLLNTDELPSAVSQWIHLNSNTDTHIHTRYWRSLTKPQKAIYRLIRDMQEEAVSWFCVHGLPAGTHHMSLLLGPALPLPGPPWPPAHTPQAAETK